MIRVTVLCVGRPDRHIASSIQEFEKRAARYFDLDVVEIKAGKGAPARMSREEGEAIMGRLDGRSRTFALTRKGDRLGSRALATELEDIGTYGPGSATWIIGGAFGLSDEVLSTADRRVSLSDLTLPHDMARLVLLEQLYRAGTILRGEPYHKGD